MRGAVMLLEQGRCRCVSQLKGWAGTASCVCQISAIPAHGFTHLQHGGVLRSAECLLCTQCSQYLHEGSEVQGQHVQVRGQVHATLQGQQSCDSSRETIAMSNII